MNKVSGCLDGVKWYRTSKQAARNAYNQGEEVLVCPVNLSPFSGVYTAGAILGSWTYPAFSQTFDYNEFVYRHHNCTDSKTGKYAAFYLKEKGKG